MAMDWPTNPTEGQLFGIYIYSGGTWRVQGSTNNVGTQIAALQAVDALNYHPNYVINGGMDISQRGTSISNINSDGTYTADRFYIARGGPVNYTQGTTTPPVGFSYYGSYVNNGASNPFMTIGQTIETKDAILLAGKTVTLSFYARANANTTLSKNFIINGMCSNTIDTKIDTVISSTNFTAPYGTTASDWARFSHTFTVPSTAKTVGFSIQSTGTLAVGDGIHLTGVQLEEGSVATPFRRAGGTIQGELAACQRYYWRATADGPYNRYAMGSGYSSTQVVILMPNPVKMRAAPTSVEANILCVWDGGTLSGSATSVSFDSAGSFASTIFLNGLTGITATRAYQMLANGSTSAYIGMSAEL